MKINEIITEGSTSKSTLFRDLKWLRTVFVMGAQRIYDRWNRKGYGDGICDDIAVRFTNILNKNIKKFGARAERYGRNKAGTHAFAVVYNDTESYAIDIPYWKYELGNNRYGWKKIDGVKFTEEDVRIFKIARLSWMDYYESE